MRRWCIVGVLVLGAWLLCVTWLAGLLLVGISMENVQATSLRLWWDYALEYWDTSHRATLIDSARRAAIYVSIVFAAFAAFALSPTPRKP